MTTSVTREIISTTFTKHKNTFQNIHNLVWNFHYSIHTHKTNDLVINKAITSKNQQQQTRKPNKDTSGTLHYVTQAGRTT